MSNPPKACTCDAISLRIGMAEVDGTLVHKMFCPGYTPPATELEAANREIAELRVALTAKTEECRKLANVLVLVNAALRGMA